MALVACSLTRTLVSPKPIFLIRSSSPKHIHRQSFSLICHKRYNKSIHCPLYSSSISYCVKPLTFGRKFVPFRPFSHSSTMDAVSDNPLLKDFDFPPYDAVEALHVRPAIRALLSKLEGDLDELERTVEPNWPKLVEPLEKIMDKLVVVWGIVSHLKAVKDTPELRSAIEEVQPEKVKFELRLGQSKPIYEAFKAIKDSPEWGTLDEARKRLVEAQLKEAVLSGVALKDDERDKFNTIEQELQKLSQKFQENVLDATKIPKTRSG